MQPTPWQFWIDVGGTFTDCVGIDPQGRKHFAKVLSTGKVNGHWSQTGARTARSNELTGYANGFWAGRTLEHGGQRLTIADSASDGTFEIDSDIPASQGQFTLASESPAPIFAIRKILSLPFSQPLPRLDIRLGTTRGTNALLTRSGARVALVTSEGFGDLLHIGFQNRPDLFAVDIKKPEPLFETSLEIRERIHFDGEVETPLDEPQVIAGLERLKEQGIESLAICLMHAYRFPQHEQGVGKLAERVGFQEISLSHRVAPEIRIVPRAFTTVLDAYLNPVLRSYIAEIRSHLHDDSALQLFSSAGTLLAADEFSGKDSLLSGPAGGVVGFSQTALKAGYEKTIGFDMGGTSTDVSRFDGTYHYQYESEKSGVMIVAPTLSIETVAAGGGSICRYEGQRFLVGPESAGAEPGPACYGKGGPLCVTDLNLYLKRIHPQLFPFQLDLGAVESHLQAIQQTLIREGGVERSLEWIADGFLQISIEKTAEAIRLVSIQKGYDVADYTLVSFGGAGGQIACRVADRLGIRRVLSHPQCSLLSAIGIGLANTSHRRTQGIYAKFEGMQIEDVARALRDDLQRDLEGDEPSTDRIEFTTHVDLRYSGTESYLTLVYETDGDLSQSFAELHQQRFGFLQDHDLEVGAVRVEAILRPTGTDTHTSDLAENDRPSNPAEDFESAAIEPVQATLSDDGTRRVDRRDLSHAASEVGPLLIYDEHTSVYLERGWEAARLPDGQLLLSRTDEFDRNEQEVEISEVEVELFNNQMFSIAEQMGEVLRATAVSVNVKERLDYSCAVFAPNGDLIANAPHIPIHLGAMAECVKALIEDNAEIGAGDVFVTNDPYRGGSHLPDITVATPCFDSTGAICFWVASRAHHAEIGGKTPGSMPIDSTCLEEEGVLIQNFRLVGKGFDRFAELEALLKSARFPSRQPDENLSDIKAQIAANRRGVDELERLSNQLNPDRCSRLIDRVTDLAARESRQVVRSLSENELTFSDSLDCGATVAVRITREGERLVIDFSGSSPTLENNLNANRTIVMSAIIYVFRLMIGKEIPLNQGILEPIDLVLPECFLNPRPAVDPANSPAIVGGNVETSQRVVDVLLGAFRIAAASQGTTNNVLFGDETFGYYETVCGGSGASAHSQGADGVQVHITNTRITDPEILESRYPVVLHEFRLREGSGGKGKHRGGHGVIRRISFRRPLTLSVLCNRYLEKGPFGMAGGEAGAPGRLAIELDDGAADHSRSAQKKCRGFRMETPGGGGWGKD